jgi:hypothetical protein
MANQYLATYLNDHLAGSVVALELLEHLEAALADSAEARALAQLRAEIAADRQELEALIERLNLARSRPRQVGAWLAEKMTEIKLRLDDPGAGALRQLESLEAVQIGIEGKRALWRALAAAAEDAPELRALDYARLERRAVEQHSRVETLRLEAARAAFRVAT